MSDEGSKKTYLLNGLIKEWSLFWQTFASEDEGDDQGEKDKQSSSFSKDPFLTGQIETLGLEQIRAITKALSSDRKKLNQKLESLRKEIDLNSAKLEALRLVGGDFEQTLQNINTLNDLGESINSQLGKINDRLKMARAREDRIKSAKRAEL